jgi:hypothetical protein
MFSPKPPRKSNVAGLCLLCSAKNQVHFISLLAEVNAIPRPKIHSQFRNAIADRFNIAKVTLFDAVNANANSSSGLHVKPRQPLGERLPAKFVMTNQNLSRNRFHAVSLA